MTLTFYVILLVQGKSGIEFASKLSRDFENLLNLLLY
jgi:hypothetical protein